MKNLSATVLATLMLISPALAVAAAPVRDVQVALPSLSDEEKTCVEQLRYNWAQPDAYDESVKRITLDTVYHRRENQTNIIMFQGKAHNDFMQADRSVTVTCRLAEKPPYAVSFQIDR